MLSLLSRNFVLFALSVLLPAAVNAQDFNSKNPFEVLGVSPSASDADIKAAYRNLLKTHHPDLNQQSPESAAITQKLNQANDALKNPLKRKLAEDEIRHRQGRRDAARAQTEARAQQEKARAAEAERARAEKARHEPTKAAEAKPEPPPQAEPKPEVKPQAEAGAKPETTAQQPPSIKEQIYQEMLAAKTPAEVGDVRAKVMDLASSGAEFMRAATENSASWNPAMRAAVVQQALNRMNKFMEFNPSIHDVNRIAALVDGKEKEIVYRTAFRAAKTPTQFLNLMNKLKEGAGGGTNWELHLRNAAELEMSRFHQMKPSPQEMRRAETLLEKHFGARRGNEILVRTIPGYKSRFTTLKHVASKFFMFDPSLVTGAARSIVEKDEADSLETLTCPDTLVSTPLPAATGYKHLLSLLTRMEREVVFQDCEQKKPGLGSKLRAQLDDYQNERLNSLSSKKNASCRRDSSGTSTIEVLNKNGLKSSMQFGSDDRFQKIEIVNQTGQGNESQFVTFNAGLEKAEVTYSSFDYKVKVDRAKQAKVSESESAFLLRVACVSNHCEEAAFQKATPQSDENIFDLDIENRSSAPKANQPFGAMDTRFLRRASSILESTLIVQRASSADFESLCRKLGGQPPGRSDLPSSMKIEKANRIIN